MTPRRTLFLRACIEIAFIIFLFYANLLMGEFNRSSPPGKTLTSAVANILTARSFVIAFLSAFVGFVTFETMRKRL